MMTYMTRSSAAAAFNTRQLNDFNPLLLRFLDTITCYVCSNVNVEFKVIFHTDVSRVTYVVSTVAIITLTMHWFSPSRSPSQDIN